MSRKACFGIMKELEYELTNEGLMAEHIWEYLKDFYKVRSRSEFTTEIWDKIARQLKSALNSEPAFDKMVRTVWKFHIAKHEEELQNRRLRQLEEEAREIIVSIDSKQEKEHVEDISAIDQGTDKVTE